MNQIIERVSYIGIVSVIAIGEAEKVVPLARALVTGGLPATETIFRTIAGEEAIRRIATEVPEMLVGAGTILATDQTDHAITAGTQFIVSLGFNLAVTRYAIDRGVLMMPDTVSPGGMEQAMGMELDVVRFFPAEQNGGMARLKALTGPYTNLRQMSTGNVNTRNLMDYLGFDKIMACDGTWIVKKDPIEGERWDEVTRICREAVQTMLGFELRHMGINCDNEAEAEKTTGIFCVLFRLPYKPGNSSVFVGGIAECMKNPYPGEHEHIIIGTNSVERIIYHLGLRGVIFSETTHKVDGVGKTKAIYLNGEVGDFAL